MNYDDSVHIEWFFFFSKPRPLEYVILDELAAPAMYHINAFAFPMIVLARHQFQNQFCIHHSSQ